MGAIYSAYQFYGNLFGCASTLVIGTLVNYLDCASNPVMIGKIIIGVLSFGYLNAAAMWWIAGNHFKAMKEGKG
jgi:hypothetical protein